MLKAQLKFKKLWLEVTADTQKELFTSIAGLTDVFSEEKCGLCGSEDIKPIVRKSSKGKQEFEYPEYHCQNPQCLARLTICLNNDKSGNMYAQRRLTDKNEPATGSKVGKYGKHNGWTKFKGDTKSDEEDK